MNIGFIINWVDDETVEIWLNGSYLCSLDHDNHGWDGMRASIDLVEAIAEELGYSVVRTEGIPNL